MRNKRKKKQQYIDYKGGACRICGYKKSSRALTFHHRERSEKEFSLSQALDWSWERVKMELDKCDLVCFNCHMELEEKLQLEKENNE
jgi:protein-arginine kinase activator protein McsA